MRNTASSHNNDIHSADTVNISENTVIRENSIPKEVTNIDDTTIRQKMQINQNN